MTLRTLFKSERDGKRGRRKE